jgi:transposase
LLKADIGQENGGWNEHQISEALDISRRTIERVRQRFVEEGLEQAINPRPKNSSKLKKIEVKAEADLIALACSEAPTGYNRWTLRALAEQMVVLEYVESISHESIRQVLKKTKSNLCRSGARTFANRSCASSDPRACWPMDTMRRARLCESIRSTPKH